MAIISIETTEEEQLQVLSVIRTLDSTKAVSVAKIADIAGMIPSRVRYAIADLINDGKIARIPLKAYNKNYIRYSYKEVKHE